MLNPFLTLKGVFPILRWIPSYDLGKILCDIIGGITVGLTLIPQSLAYAALAGLSPEYGLYSSLTGGFLYAMFGTIPELSIAPTAILSLMTYSYTYNASFGAGTAAILLCFLSGILELACGLLHLGFLVDFVSAPVVAGFTSAGAITIASAQVKNLFGLKFNAETFVDVWRKVFENIQHARYEDAVLGVSCCVTLLSLRYIKNFGTPPTQDEKAREAQGSNKNFKVFLWFLSVSRNALVVLVSATISYYMNSVGKTPFSLTSNVPAGLPKVQLPKFSIANGNQTLTIVDMVGELGSGIVVLPFLAILGNVAIAKAFAQGRVVDATQEMVAVGICNIIGSMFGSMPVNASFSRGAVSNASGVKTTFAGVYCGILAVLALTFLTPYFHYIPKATLASVIICAVLFMVEVSIIKPIWKINKIDWIPLWTTFIACLFLGLEIGILIGISIDVILLLYYNARPMISVEKISNGDIEYIKVSPSSSLLFPSAEYIRDFIMKSNAENGHSTNIVVLDCSRITKTDYTTIKCIASLANDFTTDGKKLIFLRLEEKLANVVTKTCHIKCAIIDDENQLATLYETGNDLSKTDIKNGLVKNGTLADQENTSL